MVDVKAITLHQPWASLIALGVKKIETRSWPAPKGLIGQRIAIHAGSKEPRWMLPITLNGYGVESRPRWTLSRPDGPELPLPFRAVVATATLTDCVPMVQFHSQGPGHEPVPTYTPEGPLTFPLLAINNDTSGLSIHRGGGTGIVDDMTDQLPFGDFAPGRWAWLLDDTKPVDPPIPAKGKQRVWNWDEEAA